MKNIILIIIPLFVSIIYGLFKDMIFSYLPPFFSLINFIFIIFILYILIKKANVSNALKKIILIISIILMLFNYRMLKCKIFLYFFSQEYYEIIEMVNKKEIDLDIYNNAHLPKNSFLSVDGNIYVYEINGKSFVGFWVYRGISISTSIQMIYFDSDESKIIFLDNETITKYKKIIDGWYLIYV